MVDQIRGLAHPVEEPAGEGTGFAEMVVRAQGREEDAFVRLLQRFEGRLRGYLVKQTGREDAADHLYGELMCRVWSGLPKTDVKLCQERAMKGWLYKIATNLSKDYSEGQKRLKEISLEDLEERFQKGDGGSVADWEEVLKKTQTSGVEEEICMQEDIAMAYKALKQVPGQFGICFYKKDVEEWSHQEIAQELHIQESAARSYASRGRKIFKDVLARLKEQEGGN